MLARVSTVSQLKRPVSSRAKSGVIVSKNSHRIWCIVKVQSMVRRWLAMRLLKRMKIEKLQALELQELEMTPTISAVMGIDDKLRLQQQQLPDQVELNPVGDEYNPNIIGDSSSDESEHDTNSSSSSSGVNSSAELKPVEDELLARSFEKITIVSSSSPQLQSCTTSTSTSTSTSSSTSSSPTSTREIHSASIDMTMSAETTPHPSASRSSSVSSCISSSSVCSSPAAIESVVSRYADSQQMAPITPSASSPSLLETPNNSNKQPTSSKPPVKLAATASPPASRRRKTIDEMVHVERGYVADLNSIIDVFYQPLKDLNILTNDNFYMLFSNVHELRDVHTRLLEKFESSLSQWKDESTVGDLFLPFMGDFQKLYEVYINNYEKAFAYLKYLKMNSSCASVYKKILAGECNDRCRNLDFGSFIVMPVQRLPRYIIFLKEIEKYTAPDHPDTNMAALALCQLHDLTLYLNESKRTASEVDKIAEIKSIISGADELIGSSKYIMEGQLSLLKGMVASTKKELFVYLFKECIICTQQNDKSPLSPRKVTKSKTLHANTPTHPPLSPQPSSMSLSVSLGNNRPQNNSLKRKTLFKTILFSDVKAISVLKNFKDSFQVVTSKKVYTFVAPSTEIKDKWMSALIDCQKCITPPPSPSPRSARRSVQIASQTPLSPQWKKI